MLRHHSFSLLLLCLVMTSGLRAQDESSTDISVGYGFSLGANHSLLTVRNSSPPMEGSPLRAVNKAGFSMGIHAQLDLGESIRLRPGLALSFLNHAISYQNMIGDVVEFEMPNTYLEVPFHFMFAHQNLTQNIAVIFGVRHCRALQPEISENLGLLDRFTGFEVGLGKDFDLGKFHASPEFIYSFGTQNLYRYSTVPEVAEQLDQLFLDRVMFRIVFHGEP